MTKLPKKGYIRFDLSFKSRRRQVATDLDLAIFTDFLLIPLSD